MAPRSKAGRCERRCQDAAAQRGERRVLSNPSKRRDYDLQRAGPRINVTEGAPPRSEPRQRAEPPDFRHAETARQQAEWANASTAPKGETSPPRSTAAVELADLAAEVRPPSSLRILGDYLVGLHEQPIRQGHRHAQNRRAHKLVATSYARRTSRNGRQETLVLAFLVGVVRACETVSLSPVRPAFWDTVRPGRPSHRCWPHPVT